MRVSILFLDFDGVLHSARRAPGYGLPFEHMPVLEAVMRHWPFLQVVVSSSWRQHFSLDQLRDFFSDDLRWRVLGVTPDLQHVGAQESGLRQRECEAWIAAHAPGTRWIALDDDPSLYESQSQVLVCDCELGLSDCGLRARLETWLAQ